MFITWLGVDRTWTKRDATRASGLDFNLLRQPYLLDLSARRAISYSYLQTYSEERIYEPHIHYTSNKNHHLTQHFVDLAITNEASAN